MAIKKTGKKKIVVAVGEKYHPVKENKYMSCFSESGIAISIRLHPQQIWKVTAVAKNFAGLERGDISISVPVEDIPVLFKKVGE